MLINICIFIDKATHRDGRIGVGDRLLFVNDRKLTKASLIEGTNALRSAPKGLVTIGVAKMMTQEMEALYKYTSDKWHYKDTGGATGFSLSDGAEDHLNIDIKDDLLRCSIANKLVEESLGSATEQVAEVVSRPRTPTPLAVGIMSRLSSMDDVSLHAVLLVREAIDSALVFIAKSLSMNNLTSERALSCSEELAFSLVNQVTQDAIQRLHEKKQDEEDSLSICSSTDTESECEKREPEDQIQDLLYCGSLESIVSVTNFSDSFSEDCLEPLELLSSTSINPSSDIFIASKVAHILFANACVVSSPEFLCLYLSLAILSFLP
ncbi:hypothetical protein Ciccas_001432 [Cichlidogyrus casuarinus]|uniref:PDZ domain-containing protein n=1 Tax=Cichlidogyrus casuarinus TaxID=1844966 RepID=A0ABD2QKB0_9PLAT